MTIDRVKLHSLVDEICNAADALAAESKSLKERETQLNERASHAALQMLQREQKVQEREDALESTRKIASERLARIKVLEEGQEDLKTQRANAVRDARNAELEKKRL